jgi:hypothetical protein
MMQNIGEELDAATGAFLLSWGPGPDDPAVLDLCMAPGGFAAVVLDNYDHVTVRGFSLPVEQGGHAMQLQSPDIHVQFLDLTFLAGDMGLIEGDIPPFHIDASKFTMQKQLKDTEKFDLAFCDGQVLRTHDRAEWREHREARRLTLTQLAIGLEHVKVNGTMVLLLHKLEGWDNLQLLHTFDKFAEVQLFKSYKHHATRSSFYAVVKKIQARSTEAIEAIDTWKHHWKAASLGSNIECRKVFAGTRADAQAILDSFGEKFVEMGRNVWKVQADALKEASFIKNASKNQVRPSQTPSFG